LVEKGRAWVKVSGAYHDTKVGPPDYADTSAVARAFIAAAPDRMIWGSDWPHPTVKELANKPDDAILFDLLSGWAPDASQQKPLKPGSAKMRLAEALAVPEQKG